MDAMPRGGSRAWHACCIAREHGTRGSSRGWRAALAPALLGAGLADAAACGDELPEERLSEAESAVRDAREAVRKAEEALEEERRELAGCRADLEEAREQLARAEQRQERAERRRADRATDVAIFRTLQKRLLEDEALDSVAIRAEVQDGVVTLHGAVPEADLRERALELGRSIPGAERVVDRIEVDAADGRPTSEKE
jgi:hypothetical protein